jgi:hypothetical protein
MLFLLDRAKFTEAPTGQKRPFRANYLLSAVAAEMWVIEHGRSRSEMKTGRESKKNA